MVFWSFIHNNEKRLSYVEARLLEHKKDGADTWLVTIDNDEFEFKYRPLNDGLDHIRVISESLSQFLQTRP